MSPRQVHYTKCTITKCTISTCEKALKDAEVTKYDIEDVLSGGWDDVMPKVQETVQQLFPQTPNKSEQPCIQSAVLN